MADRKPDSGGRSTVDVSPKYTRTNVDLGRARGGQVSRGG